VVVEDPRPKTQDPRPFPSMFCGGAFFCFWRARAVLTHSLRWYVIRPSAPLWLDLHFANKTTPTQVKRQVPNLFPEVDWLSCDRGLLPRLNIASQRLDGKVLDFNHPSPRWMASNQPRCSFLFPFVPSLRMDHHYRYHYHHSLHTYRPALPSNICHSYALE
jgi:hypothetical protein